MKALLVALLAGPALAQTALSPPQVGFMQDGSGLLRPVDGIAGNFLVGDALAANVLSAAFSGSSGLVKTGSAVLAIDQDGRTTASLDAPDGPALFAFSPSGEPALAYVPAANLLIAWNHGAFEAMPIDLAALGGIVLSIAAPDTGHVGVVVQQDDGLWDISVVLATGEVDSRTVLPGIAAPVLLLATGELVYRDADGIVIRKAGDAERHIKAQLPENFALQQLGDGWIQIRDLAGGLQFALRITDGREQLYQLPEAAQ